MNLANCCEPCITIVTTSEGTQCRFRRNATGPLVGLKVLEIGHYIAAPFCTRILADLGAEVIKVEPPGGDPFRGWGASVDGHSVWFSVHGRNKLSVVLDLKRDRDTLLKLAGARRRAGGEPARRRARAPGARA